MKEPNWRDYLKAQSQSEKEIKHIKINPDSCLDTLEEEALAFVNRLKTVKERALEIMIEEGFNIQE